MDNFIGKKLNPET